jgi:ring-1,2-phenylacetyl-CoA epoxidase subunit PaaD
VSVANAVATGLSREQVLAALDDVKDPEIPVVSVVELGIVQAIRIDGRHVTVAITPTFSGCPALELMRQEIRERVLALGASEVDVPVVLDPPWSTDRVAPEAWQRMKAMGLAPPPPHATRFLADSDLMLQVIAPQPVVACPFCGSHDTSLENAFGPTICRALHYCHACQQPFEEFKAL